MRCNTGVNPKYLPDQMLIAEQVELLMIGGLLKRINFEPKSEIPKEFKMGKGHMLFWVNKLLYLQKRHNEVKKEVSRRGFKSTDRVIELNEFPEKFRNDWAVENKDTNILRERLVWKLNNKPKIWRYKSKYISDINEAIKNIKEGELFYV